MATTMIPWNKVEAARKTDKAYTDTCTSTRAMHAHI
jgi:hypothetical protein